MPARPIRAALALSALLYAGIAPAANAADGAGPQAIAALATGSLSKLVVHDAPRPALEAAFLNGAGERVSLAAFRGKVVLVNFWATWCPPCIEEMPSLDALSREMGGEDFAVVAISTDFGGLEKPRAFLEEKGLDALALHLDAEKELARAAAVTGLPVTLLLDREGREVARLLGAAEWDGPAAKAVITRMIAAGPATN